MILAIIRSYAHRLQLSSKTFSETFQLGLGIATTIFHAIFCLFWSMTVKNGGFCLFLEIRSLEFVNFCIKPSLLFRFLGENSKITFWPKIYKTFHTLGGFRFFFQKKGKRFFIPFHYFQYGLYSWSWHFYFLPYANWSVFGQQW